MTYFLRTGTYQTARSRGTNLASTTPGFWQVFGVIMFTCFGLASSAWACHDASTLTTATPTSLTYYAVQGATNPPQTINVSRKSTWQATITASDNASWLSVYPPKTYITTSAKFAATVNTTGLAAGTYRGTITIMVGTWCTKTVSATLVLSPPNTPPPSTTTKSATATWSAGTSTPITGYRIYVGEAPRQYSRTITVGNVTSATISSLTVGRTYYFVVSAYNSGGEGPPSSPEVIKTIQ